MFNWLSSTISHTIFTDTMTHSQEYFNLHIKYLNDQCRSAENRINLGDCWICQLREKESISISFCHVTLHSAQSDPTQLAI